MRRKGSAPPSSFQRPGKKGLKAGDMESEGMELPKPKPREKQVKGPTKSSKSKKGMC